VAIVSYLGLVSGVFLASSNHDELKPGKRYLFSVQKIIFALIVLSIALVFKNALFTIVAAVISAVPFFVKKKFYLPLIYPFLGIVFYIASYEKAAFVIIASLIFLFGIPSGTLLRIGKNGKIKNGFVKEILFNLGFFICLIPFLI
jgi:hypothetical protein